MSVLGPPWAGWMERAPHEDLWAIFDTRGGPAAAARAARAGDLPCPSISVAEAPGLSAITAEDDGWPVELRGLPDGPAALLLRGDQALLSKRRVAIVGARRCTGRGRADAAQIARAVVVAGGVVVSGMAMGIDAEAHTAACRAGYGGTIAVLGMGIDAPTAGWQARLRAHILSGGGLIASEFLPDRRATVWSFPLRNRIIAGLAHAVVVVEAGDPSGARITADAARRYGRPLLACPPDPERAALPIGAGCLRLLEEGAAPADPASVCRAAGLW